MPIGCVILHGIDIQTYQQIEELFMIKFLIEKEFKQLLRNSFLPKLILVFPCMIMLLMPWAVNLEIKNIQLNIVDNDHSAISQRFSQ